MDSATRARPFGRPTPLLGARALLPGHQPAHARRAAARPRGRRDPRARELPRDAAAGRVLADGERAVAPADHRRDARVRPRLAPLRAPAPARALARLGPVPPRPGPR